ncbi:3'-_5' exoribonuclease [Oceanotoga phage vB_OteS-UFV02]
MMKALHEVHESEDYNIHTVAYVGAIKEDKRGVIVNVMSGELQMALVIWNVKLNEEAKKALDNYICFTYNPAKYNDKFKTLTVVDFDIISKEEIKKSDEIYNIVMTVKPYIDRDELFQTLVDRLDRLNKGYSKLLFDYKEIFMAQRASTKFHHNYIGGLLRHMLQVLMIAENISTMYKDVDMELLTLGAIFHDIGKLDTYDMETGSTTEFDRLYGGHLLTGQKYIYKYFSNYERLDDLINVVASHHGCKDWGALAYPATLEAQIIFTADYLSSHGDTKLIDETITKGDESNECF